MNSLTGYKKEKLTIDLVQANIFGLVMIIPILIIYGLPFFLLWKGNPEVFRIGSKSFLDSLPTSAFTMLLIFIAGIILHELIHGITWSFFTKDKNFKSIRFGVMWQMLTPYCHCKEPLKVKHYVAGALMPAIILGIIPAIIAIATGNFWLLLFAFFFTVAACGDLLMIYTLRKENKEDYVEDHPSEVGCFIYRKIEENQ